MKKKPYNRGESNGRAKLTESDVRLIRALFKENQQYVKLARETSQTAIGKKFGISKNQVGKIVSGQDWKHVPMEGEEERS